MDRLSAALSGVREVLDTALFQIGDRPVTIGTLVTTLIVILVTVIVARLVKRGLRRVLSRRGVKDESTVGLVSTLANYAILIIGVGIALQTAGVEIGALFAAGALFAVGIGLAVQDVVKSFVSGIILLSERSIRPGDVLEVEGRLVRVEEMGIRATIVYSRLGERLIVPNSVLVQSTVKSFERVQKAYRISCVVGVHYSSDMHTVREVLEQVARTFEGAVNKDDFLLFLTEFGNSSVNWEVAVWIDDPWERRVHESALYEAVWHALENAGITIAFPQLDVHFDSPMPKLA